jgi:hypothetical protein
VLDERLDRLFSTFRGLNVPHRITFRVMIPFQISI